MCDIMLFIYFYVVTSIAYRLLAVDITPGTILWLFGLQQSFLVKVLKNQVSKIIIIMIIIKMKMRFQSGIINTTTVNTMSIFSVRKIHRFYLFCTSQSRCWSWAPFSPLSPVFPFPPWGPWGFRSFVSLWSDLE